MNNRRSSLLFLGFLCLQGWQCYGLMKTLSPFEVTVLRSRLEGIEQAIVQQYQEIGDPEAELSTFIFPGAGGVDDLVRELAQKTPNSKIVDWKDHRGSIFTAAYDGEAVGEAIAKLLMTGKATTQSYNFVGISVGAFCANAAATVLYQEDPTRNVRLTLLDPFCGRGILGNSYGKEHFGKFCTSALQLLNTDDPVPTTNDPLPYCFCIDVTGAKERKSFTPLPGDSMHSWPLAYFARHFEEPPGPWKRDTVVQV